jgi:Bacterial Ig-like domain (group 2)/Kelch motif/Galactose oxidase, central domain
MLLMISPSTSYRNVNCTMLVFRGQLCLALHRTLRVRHLWRCLRWLLASLCSLGCSSNNSITTTTAASSTPYSLAVTPNFPVNPPGSSIQFTATASFEGVSSPPPIGITVTEDVTNKASWSSSAPNVAMVSAAGLVTALTTGETTIQASFDGVQGNNVLIVADTASFIPDANMTISRNFQSATLMNNGQVLIAGGGNNIPVNGPLSSAELYDPIAKTFTATGSMTVPRQYATATLLSNGMVLIAGGTNFAGTFATAELYNPAQGAFTLTGSMSVARANHTATLLNDGKVLIAGGGGAAVFSGLSSAEIYDPATGAFTVTGSMNDARQGQTATLLNNGTVLITGGINSNPIASAELYDPIKGTFTVTGSMTVARWGHTATRITEWFSSLAAKRTMRGSVGFE